MSKLQKINDIKNVVQGEYVATVGSGKLLLIAIFFNLPIDFIPYLSQAVTIITLSLFLKKYLVSPEDSDEISKEVGGYRISKFTIALIVGTMIYQLPFFWIPFLTQIVTLILLGLIYATSSKYQK